MKSAWVLSGLLFWGSGTLLIAAKPSPIPRTASSNFRTEGLFEGGSGKSANLEALRLSDHGEYERWVVDFSGGAKREQGKVAPRFQVRYLPGDRIIGESGEAILSRQPKFILTFRAVRKNFLSRAALQELVKRSRHVKDIVVYPPVEDGDMAIEMILHDNVAFEPHQPVQKEGRLVLDLRDHKG